MISAAAALKLLATGRTPGQTFCSPVHIRHILRLAEAVQAWMRRMVEVDANDAVQLRIDDERVGNKLRAFAGRSGTLVHFKQAIRKLVYEYSPARRRGDEEYEEVEHEP